jgi:hypothetical protein
MRLSELRHASFLLAMVLGACAGSSGMAIAPAKLTLHAGEAAQLELGLRPGRYHQIEISAASVGAGGAELVLGSNGVEVPPIYFPAGGVDVGGVDARFWSPHWPVGEGGSLRIANYGPDFVTIDRVRARAGVAGALDPNLRERLPPSPAWSDLKSLQERAPLSRDRAEQPPVEIAGARAWMNQQRRRIAFEAIQGPPIPVRMAEPIRGNVQVRSCAVGLSGAVVGFSRPDSTHWIPLGPGWYPARESARWRALPADRGMPRGFEWRGGKLQRLAVYLADPRAGEGRGGAVSARLFRLDSAEPVVAADWYDIGASGRWFELVPEESQGAGLYILELRAVTGAPLWLTWDAEAEQIPGEKFPRPNETLVIQAVDPVPDYEPPIDVQAQVLGTGDRIEILRGGTAVPGGRSAGIGREITLRASLAPGETEIHYIQNYRSPVPAPAGDETEPKVRKRSWRERFGFGVGIRF